MPIREKLIAKANAHNMKLVLPEGNDPRVVKAAVKILAQGIAKQVIVLGTADELDKACATAGLKDRPFLVEDPRKSPRLEAYAAKFVEMRAKRKKEVSFDQAVEAMANRLFFGCMMTTDKSVDGMVAGSIASTPDMLRSAFTVIGTAPGIKTGSSCFVMDLKTPTISGDETLLYADCGVNPNPDAEMLVDIAIATSQTYRALLGLQPKIAFLSFSTKGSATHEILDKIIKATELTKQRIAAEKLDILVDGELQGDAALVPSVAASKSPDSPLKGAANILIFPDLNAGNICYKITERLAGAAAYGPILQGLAKPVNDLSRGCSDDDIVGVAAITICQAIG